jgi:hypothetical protein
MRLVAMATMLMATTCCFASETAYELSLDLTIDGKHVASPHVVVKDGVKLTINLEDKFIDVLTRASPEYKGIDMTFWIGELKGGVRKIVVTPHVVAPAGQQAELRVSLDDQTSGMKRLTLIVLAQEHLP